MSDVSPVWHGYRAGRMKQLETPCRHQTDAAGFEMFRLSRAKEVADIAPNTLREYHRLGLPFYRLGRAVFVSKAELAAFIRARALVGKSAAKEAE